MAYRIKIEDGAWNEILEQVAWYTTHSRGAGERFYKALNDQLETLRQFPYAQIRYSTIRCVPVTGFPVMIHFSIEEDNNMVIVHALLHTSRNPEANWGPDDWFVSEPEIVYGPVNA